MLSRQTSVIALLMTQSVLFCTTGFADETKAPASQKLKNEQEAISGRFARFERVLSQMADMLGYEDPERAELLRRAISQGREQEISTMLEAISSDLGQSQFGSALEKQKSVTTSLKSLLKLLQSEDRMSSVERERERLKTLLNEINNIKAMQRSARASAQNSTAPSNAAPTQQKALSKTDEALDKVEKHDQSQNESDKESDGAEQDKNSKGADNKSPDANSENETGEKPDGQQKPDEKEEGDKPSEKNPEGNKSDPKDPSGDPSSQDQQSPPKDGSDQKSQSQQSQPGQNGQQSQNGEQPEQTPGRRELEKAKQLMQEALDQLKEQERKQAVKKQDDAIAELQKAANELEEKLRQLREEEKEMILAALEARFQRLLALQTQIFDATINLAATPREDWLDNAVGECRVLAQEQTELTRECSYTTSLLREDGTSVSILVAVEDIERDMGTVAERLEKTKVGTLTQSMETDVIEALKELIEATQREMQEMKSQQRKQQQQQANQDKPPLVELMAEIKVLRSLQLRVNRRTKQVNDLFSEAETDDLTDLQEQLLELANRQDRLRESASELAKKMERKR